MADIFLSYSRVDRAKAQVIAKNLEAEGFSVWWDKVLRAGQTYDEVTEGMLRSADAVVVLWSQTSVKSKWVRAEATLGERSSAVVPAMIEDAERPIMFELVQTADLIGWDGDRDEERWKIFVDDLRLAIGEEEGSNSDNETDKKPEYKEELTAPPPPPPPEETLEEQFWNAITDDQDLDALNEYNQRYPDGRHVDEAKSRIDAIEAEKQATRAAEEEARRAEQDQIKQQRDAEAQANRDREARQKAESDRQEAALAQSAPSTSQSDSKLVSEEEKPSSNSMMLIGIIGAVVLLGGAGTAFFMLGGSGDETENASNELASDATQSEELTDSLSQETESENVADVANESQPDDETTATDEIIEPDVSTEDVTPTGEDMAVSSESDAGTVEEEGIEESAEVPAAPADTFSDCELCPEMKRFDEAVFVMGSPDTEIGHVAYEGPLTEMDLNPFAISIAEVTYDEWEACVTDGGCNGYSPVDRGYGKGDQPVMSISWNDAQGYVRWLSQETGRNYRLPSEAEWEFAARGGTQTAFWWGDRFDSNQVPTNQPYAASQLPANPYGIKGTLGNLREWVQDCYENNYNDIPTDGRAVTAGDCSRRVMRGGSWNSSSNEIRVANRSRISISTRDRSYGFRVATSDLP